MASREDIEATYGYMDAVWRSALGPHADITNALWDGDYSKDLDQAQYDKQQYILRQIGFEPGMRILDIGSGWGGLLVRIRERGGRGVGLTLCRRQELACRRAGLDVHLQDWRQMDSSAYGEFDAIASVGAFEHFCSEEEYLAGEQEGIYRRFFALCHQLLPPKARLFLQTMTWGREVPDPASITLDAPKGSDLYIMAILKHFYPGSWLPAGLEQIQAAAEPYFRTVDVLNGRLDYIETMERWGQRLARPTVGNVWAAVKSLRYLVTDRDLRHKLEVLRGSYNQLCFKRQIMDHFRITFERSPALAS